MKRLRTFLLAALVVATLVSWLPLFGLLAGSGAESALGCRVDEVTAHPCIVAGLDFGPFLHVAVLVGWLILIVWPGIFATGAIWLGILIWIAVRTVRRRPFESG